MGVDTGHLIFARMVGGRYIQVAFASSGQMSSACFAPADVASEKIRTGRRRELK